MQKDNGNKEQRMAEKQTREGEGGGERGEGDSSVKLLRFQGRK